MISYLIFSEVFPLCLTVFFSLPYKTMPRSISFRHGLQVHDKRQGCLWALVTPHCLYHFCGFFWKQQS